jgi:hypothetical protein
MAPLRDLRLRAGPVEMNGRQWRRRVHAGLVVRILKDAALGRHEDLVARLSAGESLRGARWRALAFWPRS